MKCNASISIKAIFHLPFLIKLIFDHQNSLCPKFIGQFNNWVVTNPKDACNCQKTSFSKPLVEFLFSNQFLVCFPSLLFFSPGESRKWIVPKFCLLSFQLFTFLVCLIWVTTQNSNLCECSSPLFCFLLFPIIFSHQWNSILRNLHMCQRRHVLVILVQSEF